MTSLHNHHKNTTLRLLTSPTPTPSNPPSSDSFEFQESDLFFSPSSDTQSVSVSPPTPPTPSHLPRQPTHLSSFHGLSAALSTDHHPLLRRKSALNPSVSAVRTIPQRSEGSHGAKFHQSAPMNVPVWPKKETRAKNFDEIEEEEDEGDEEMIPPHEIVARSHVTFSVFEGVGRTLKGRDLRRVRNAVFQQTGFLD
ncbi:hypothetical protein DCAR_0312028 [Daucus carota subsp. sativus]|uniref:Senescence regulator S40 n=1 Tax=Daucus carota subsp. sativus TaxID=79200 RepID=A0AAF0WQR9_DAUCS|nr:hypothetical protein DCAR_0312028 [Daucus carota subsp. sativus]